MSNESVTNCSAQSAFIGGMKSLRGMGKMRTADRGLRNVLTGKLRTGICGPDIADQWVKCGLKIADFIAGMRNSIFHILWAIRPIYMELSGAYLLSTTALNNTKN